MKLFRFLFTSIGIPMIAHQVRHETQKVTSKLVLVTFVTTHQKEIIRTLLLGIFGLVCTVSGLFFILFSMAQYYDLNLHGMTASLGVSLVIVLIGLGLDLGTWTKYKKLRDRYQLEVFAVRKPQTFLKTFIQSLIQSFIGEQRSWETQGSESIN